MTDRDHINDMLHDAQAGVVLAGENLDRALETRLFWIRRAIDAGVSQADVARATGLTRGRVAQLVAKD